MRTAVVRPTAMERIAAVMAAAVSADGASPVPGAIRMASASWSVSPIVRASSAALTAVAVSADPVAWAKPATLRGSASAFPTATTRRAAPTAAEAVAVNVASGSPVLPQGSASLLRRFAVTAIAWA